MVVILGKTLAEARYWKSIYMAAYPELEGAKEVSSFQTKALAGLRVTKIFVAPGEYRELTALEILKYNQSKILGNWDGAVIFLGSKV